MIFFVIKILTEIQIKKKVLKSCTLCVALLVKSCKEGALVLFVLNDLKKKVVFDTRNYKADEDRI